MAEMPWRRILTALLLAPAAIALILVAPSPIVWGAFSLLMLVGAWEWARLAGVRVAAGRGAHVAITLLAMILIARGGEGWPQLAYGVAVAGILWWGLALLLVMRGPLGNTPSPRPSSLKLLAGHLVLLPCWYSLLALHDRSENGPTLVLYIVALMWVVDSGAYFAGRRWGRRKLAPRVSPGKTWEGVGGALVAAALYALLLGEVVLPGQAGILLLLSLLLVPVSIVGDLLVSVMKREAGVKDTGTLFPGHGGLLDRFDSLTASAPFFYAGLHSLELLP
ncbi:MAG TPA: phosphatidate cytidylyltransferase [Thiotrichales bacterium]|nr:phosphatidate cytidylyltransferase [Thiotrichales bacterium]